MKRRYISLLIALFLFMSNTFTSYAATNADTEYVTYYIQVGENEYKIEKSADNTYIKVTSILTGAYTEGVYHDENNTLVFTDENNIPHVASYTNNGVKFDDVDFITMTRNMNEQVGISRSNLVGYDWGCYGTFTTTSVLTAEIVAGGVTAIIAVLLTDPVLGIAAGYLADIILDAYLDGHATIYYIYQNWMKMVSTYVMNQKYYIIPHSDAEFRNPLLDENGNYITYWTPVQEIRV